MCYSGHKKIFGRYFRCCHRNCRKENTIEKKIYTQPELDVIRFETEDVITTSYDDTTGGNVIV